ncbi:MAG TPA: GyrI-like domain-containing protein [Acidimicrobiia bacterium]|jgi:effector-binding domain-containing protein|nr:GyrI-like domain-containing protein [Acidimicrobiia bacterium]
MSAAIDIHTRAPEVAIVTDVETDFAAISDAFDVAFRCLVGYMNERGIAPTGPAFAVYHEVAADAPWRATVGFPVETPGPGMDGIRAGVLPGGKVAVVVHEGPYEGLSQTWAEIGEWLRTQGVAPAGDPWESYVVDDSTEPEPGHWRTEIVWPVT